MQKVIGVLREFFVLFVIVRGKLVNLKDLITITFFNFMIFIYN